MMSEFWRYRFIRAKLVKCVLKVEFIETYALYTSLATVTLLIVISRLSRNLQRIFMLNLLSLLNVLYSLSSFAFQWGAADAFFYMIIIHRFIVMFI